ncbi:MAG: hypothetical protein ACRD2F_09625, partial [Terriglobales bacterium]
MSAAAPQPLGVFSPATPAAPAEKQWQQFALWVSAGATLLAVVLLGAASTAAWVLVDCLLWLGLVILVVGAARDGVRLPWHP